MCLDSTHSCQGVPQEFAIHQMPSAKIMNRKAPRLMVLTTVVLPDLLNVHTQAS